MNHLSQEIIRLRGDNPEIADVFSVFEEINNAYNETLEIMGETTIQTPTVWNSADITISFRNMPSSYGL